MSNTSKDWLLIFTFSPVQGFIRASKKTKDLFAGSYLLSFLTFKVIKAFEKNTTPGVDKIIYPVVKEEIEHFHQLLMGNYPNRFVALLRNKTSCEVKHLIKTLKSQFNYEIEKIACAEEEFIKEFLKDLDRYKCRLEGITNLIGAKKQFPKHILDYFQVFITAKEIKSLCNYKKEYEKTEKLLGGRKTFRPYKGDIDNATYKKRKNKQEVCLFPDGCTTCGERLHLAIDWENAKLEDIKEGERLCGLCYAKRKLADIYLLKDKDIRNYLEEVKRKDKSLQGGSFEEELDLAFNRFPSTHDIALAKEKYEFFLELAEVLKGNLLEEFLTNLLKVVLVFRDQGSIAYGINPYWRDKLRIGVSQKWVGIIEEVINKFKEDKSFQKFFRDEKHLKKLIERYKIVLKNPWMVSIHLLSTHELKNLEKDLIREREEQKKIETDRNISEELKLLEEYKNILKPIFGLLKREKGKNYEKIFNRVPYFGIIFSDGDNIGKILGGDREILQECKGFSLEFHKKFSEKLSEYATSVAKELEESPPVENPGFIKVIYAGGDDIFAFVQPNEVIRTLKTSSERYREKLKCLLKEEKATTSAGVVIGHSKVSLKYLLTKTYEGESEAKNSFGRNAFVVKVISRSGEETTFGSKYRYEGFERPLQLLEKLSKHYASGKISSKLPYALRELADRYFSAGENPNVENDVEEIEKLLETEREKFNLAKVLLKRELKRKVNLQDSEKEKLIEEVEAFFKSQFEEHTEKPLKEKIESLRNPEKENKQPRKTLFVGDLLKNLAGMFYVARTLSGWEEDE